MEYFFRSKKFSLALKSFASIEKFLKRGKFSQTLEIFHKPGKIQ